MTVLLGGCRTRQKPKMDIVLMKSQEFDDIIAQENQGPTGLAGEDVAAELEGASSLPELRRLRALAAAEHFAP